MTMLEDISITAAIFILVWLAWVVGLFMGFIHGFVGGRQARAWHFPRRWERKMK